MMNGTEKIAVLLSLIAGLSGLILAWRSHNIQERASIIDDLDQIRQALKDENERLGREIEQLRKRLENEMLKRVALEDRLIQERNVFSQRIEELEIEVRKLRLLANVQVKK